MLPAPVITGLTTEISQGLMKDFIEYKKTLAAEKTKRQAVRAARDCYIAKINASRDTLKQYLDFSFKERRENFDQLFSALDRAMDNDNLEQMGLILSQVDQMVKTSPLKQAEDFMAKLASGNNNELIEF